MHCPDDNTVIPSSPHPSDPGSTIVDDSATGAGADTADTAGPGAEQPEDSDAAGRAIIHLDMASFYAQCEELRDPILATLPLGIQQKQIIVTCNYVARARGVGKLMLVTDALRACPDLVIRSGEDLTYYRSVSDSIYSLLRRRASSPSTHPHLPLPDHIRIERLGLDELFIDTSPLPIPGSPATLPTNCIVKPPTPTPLCIAPLLVHAAHWAHVIQSALHTHLNLTCSIGVGSSKLAAKLASGFRKPAGLGVLLPAGVADVLAPMPMGGVPGLGYRVRKVLVDGGLVSGKDATVREVRERVTWTDWSRVVGGVVGEARARQVWDAVRGVDSTPVTNTSHPTQLSTEDSFRPRSITSRAAFDVAARHLVAQLLARYRAEARAHKVVATRFRLSVRLAGDGWARKSASVAVRVPAAAAEAGRGEAQGEDAVVAWIMDRAVRVVADRLVGSGGPMDLTLINVAFTNLELQPSAATSRSTLDSFFAAGSSTRLVPSPPVMIMVEDEPPDTPSVGGGGGAPASMQCPMCNEQVWPWAIEVHLLTHNVSL